MNLICLPPRPRGWRLVVGATWLVAAAAPVPVAWAVPAAPIEHRLTQPDGHTFIARQWGDEWNRGWETREGYAIVRDAHSREWLYAQRGPDGELMSSWAVVGRQAPDLGTPRSLRPERDLMEAKRAERLRGLDGVTAWSGQTAPASAAPRGTAPVLTLLITFSDRSPTYTPSHFNALLFGTDTYSMKDFYAEASYGQFTVSAGPGGIGGWYMAAAGHAYYGANVGGDDAWPGDLVHAAVKAADDAGFDFRPYDLDGDCFVDVANIVHQGNGEEASGAADDIWSHRWNLASAQYYGASHQGVYTTRSPCVSGTSFIKVNDYVMQPETLWGGISTVGVFAHEYGHALGLPDLYDYGYDSAGVGDWSLMAGGSWNGLSRAGDRPAQLEAWSKYRLGWVTPTPITSPTPVAVTLAPGTEEPTVYQFLSGSALTGTGEYFLLENRQQYGFDAGLPGAGLLVWHVDETKGNNDGQCFPGGPACATQHYKVALVQADNLWELEKDLDQGDAGDPFPGAAKRTALDDATSPNSRRYSGTASNIRITNIALAGADLTATLALGAGPPSLSALAITGPDSVNEGAGATFGATATFSDGSTQTVAPTWSENASYTTITSGGVLSAGQVSGHRPVTLTARYSVAGITRSATKTVTIVDLTPKTLSALTLAGPATVAEAGAATFAATAKFSDGSTASVTPTWSENSTFAAISSAGVLTAGNVSSDQRVTVTARYTVAGITRSASKTVTIVNFVANPLVALTITGPSAVAEDSATPFTATATFADGSTWQSVLPTWSDNSSYAALSASGILTVGGVSSPQTVTLKASFTVEGITRQATKAVTILNVVTRVLSALSIAGPSTVTEGSTATYTARATFTDGTTATVPVLWSDNSSYVGLSSTGVLTTGVISRNLNVRLCATYREDGLSRNATQYVTLINR